MQVAVYTETRIHPWPNKVREGWLCCPWIVWEPTLTYRGNELKRYWSGNARPQSSQLAEPLWTDPGLKSGIYVRELISTLNKIAGVDWFIKKSSPNILKCEEKPPPPQPSVKNQSIHPHFLWSGATCLSQKCHTVFSWFDHSSVLLIMLAPHRHPTPLLKKKNSLFI